MEPMDDPSLRKLLDEWKAPDAPASLDERIFGRPLPWWKFLIGGSIRVPAPVILATIVALVFLSLNALRGSAGSPNIDLKHFQPVQNPNPRIVRSGYEIR